MLTKKAIPLLIAVSPLGVGAVALFMGAYSVQPWLVAKILASKVLGGAVVGGDLPELAIIWNIRLPRIVLASLVGAALSGAGVALQGVFRNPLGGILSSLGFPPGRPLGAPSRWPFSRPFPSRFPPFSSASSPRLWPTGWRKTRGRFSRLPLVLSGVVVSAFFTALVSILKFLVDPHKLASIVYWLMGSFRPTGMRSFRLRLA